MKPDRYREFAELAGHEREGIDYQVRFHSRASAVLVIAPHGGKIEPGTAEIGEAIAGEHFSFYAFEGIKRGHNHDLRLSGCRFDEPECLSMLERSGAAVVITGLPDLKAEYAVVGGAHEAARQALCASLATAGFDARMPEPGGERLCDRFRPGVEIAVSRALRERLKDGTSDLDDFAEAARGALTAFDQRGG